MIEMKYDLIVVGGGPGGLMAARTAAEDGLKVLLVERKKNITEVNRYCGQIFYTRKLSSSKAGLHGDGYIESVSVEVDFETNRFHFPGPGFSLNYNGPLVPYLNWVAISPSKYLVYRRKQTLWAFQFSKEAFLAELLALARKAGAEILPETIGVAAENNSDGVKVLMRGKSGEQTLEARTVIAADGVSSSIVDSLGLNKERQVLSSRGMKLICYHLEGVETDLPPFSWADICIPSVTRVMGGLLMGMLADDKTQLGSSSEEILQRFMSHPNFAPWFRHAQVVKKTGLSGGAKYGILSAIMEPVEGNVVIVGDAGAPIEAWIQGAVASAYMAVKAIEKELSGQKGYLEYIDWWQNAFYFCRQKDYFRNVFGIFALSNAWSCDEDVDYVYKLFQDREGSPFTLVSQNQELIKEGRPELYDRFVKGYEEIERVVSKIKPF